MNGKGQKGSITIFLSLACILFLSLICTVVESARIQGAKTQTANITGMGAFSLLGEFERELLDQYSIFALNGTYGHGSFQIEKADERMKSFLLCNADPQEDTLSSLCFDPWNLELMECQVSQYALLTDNYGDPFYQQAVAYMRANAGVFAVDKLAEYADDAKQAETGQKEYEKSKKDNKSKLDSLKGQKQKKEEELEAQADSGSMTVTEHPVENPLDSIEKLKKRDVLDIVTWDREVSGKKVNQKALPSKSLRNRGNLRIEKKYGGRTSDALFIEYLMMHFPDYSSVEEKNGLDYQLEYIVGGKASDRDNLKYVVNHLLMIREGMNYLYCVKNPQINAQAEGLAAALTGFLAMPALTAATKHALLLALAYGESLIDIRILLDDGKVPLWKDDSSWSLSLENLGRVTEILQQGAKGKENGLTYREYLRILLYTGIVSQQRMRALDMIQAELRGQEKTSEFKAENCIVAVRTKAAWEIKPVFFRLPQAILGIFGGNVQVTQESSLSY